MSEVEIGNASAHCDARRQEMREPEEVVARLRLHRLGSRPCTIPSERKGRSGRSTRSRLESEDHEHGVPTEQFVPYLAFLPVASHRGAVGIIYTHAANKGYARTVISARRPPLCQYDVRHLPSMN